MPSPSSATSLQALLEQWGNASPTLTVHTSGSTGLPKPIAVEKQLMLNSARMTCDYLALHKGNTALLCMPLRFIAGIMMVVRALERGLQLITVEPDGHPLASHASHLIDFSQEQTVPPHTLKRQTEHLIDFSQEQTVPPHTLKRQTEHLIDFAAMVPMQVWNTLQVPAERQRLKRIKHLIIGGGAISPELETELLHLIAECQNETHSSASPTPIDAPPSPTPSFCPHIWSSYGMTETLSHIALRPIGDAWYTPLPGVSLTQDQEGCLIISAPHLCPTVLHTHDIVTFDTSTEHLPQRFRIIGRKDNTICSGGIKIQIEEVEQTLHPVFGDTIQVTSLPHPKFGEVVVYLTTKPIDKQLLRLCIPNPYWLPKRIIPVDTLPRTATGKPNRAKAKEMASQATNRPLTEP